MRVILKGDPKEVNKVIQENRLRIELGLVDFIVLPEDDKAAPETTPKATPKRTPKAG